MMGIFSYANDDFYILTYVPDGFLLWKILAFHVQGYLTSRCITHHKDNVEVVSGSTIALVGVA
jgi:hypothetical protein